MGLKAQLHMGSRKVSDGWLSAQAQGRLSIRLSVVLKESIRSLAANSGQGDCLDKKVVMTLSSPSSTICPRLTIEQARRLNAIKREHNVIGYEANFGPLPYDTYVVFVTTRNEFAVLPDGTILSPSSDLPARSASGRRRSLREHPADIPGRQ